MAAGASANPQASMMARSIVDQLVSGGRAGSPIPQPTGTQAPEMGQSQLASSLAELRQADPQAIQRTLNAMKKQIVDLIPQVAFTIPGMNKHLPNLLKTVEAALKEVEQASNTMGAVGGMSNPSKQPQAQMNPLQSSMTKADTSGAPGGAPGFPF